MRFIVGTILTVFVLALAWFAVREALESTLVKAYVCGSPEVIAWPTPAPDVKVLITPEKPLATMTKQVKQTHRKKHREERIDVWKP